MSITLSGSATGIPGMSRRLPLIAHRASCVLIGFQAGRR